MRCRISCQSSTSRAPIRLVANRPVTQHDRQRHHRAHAGHVHAEPVLGAELQRQQQQHLVERIDDQLQHPERDDERDPDQQAGDEVFLHVLETKKPGKSAGPECWPFRINSWCWPASSSPAWLRSSFRSWFRSSLRPSASAFASGLASAFASAFLPLLLKSVAYQPEPFSWKPAARQLLRILLLAAGRALGQRRLGQLLQVVLLVAAGRAAIFVDRHVSGQNACASSS